MTRRLGWLVFATCMLLLAIPSVARAQSAIAGVVKDPSGAVLPGVTVEASSDVLIEKTRVAVTDGSGLYNIQNLRPGTYVIAFTLTGFQTFRREGLELPGGFTATVDATMRVGAIEEAVTVTGASPVVDVQSNVKSQVLPRDVLDSVPNAHTIQSVGQLIPGVTLTSPDVGGSVQMQQTYFSVHGFGASGTTVMMDGMVINSLQGDGAIQSYFTTAGSAEMVYQTGGGGGDSPSGGLVINMVPREGGNRFSGTSSLGIERWQSDNFGQELKDLGVTSVDKLGTYHDWDITQGGPIKKDKIWIFGVVRLSKEDKPVANTTNVAQFPGWSASSLTDATQSASLLAQCRAAGSACPQGHSIETINSLLGRLTMQVTGKAKLQLYTDRVHKVRDTAQGAKDDQAVTAIYWDSPNYSTSAAKLTATLTNRLLVEGGFSETIERYNNRYQPGLEQPYYTALWYTLASRNNTTDAQSSVAPGGESHQYPDRYNLQGSTSYVTGTHNIKVGVLYTTGIFNRGYYKNADLIQQYHTDNGVQNVAYQAALYPTDNRYGDKLNYAGDVYAQDSWTHKRLTVTGGIRYDFLQEANQGFPIQQGTFETIPAYDTINMPKQTNFSPRVSGVYDLFGNGKTAIRAGLSHIVATATDGLAESVSPSANISGSTTATVAWTDVNNDNVVEYTVHPLPGGGVNGCTNYGQLGCELRFADLPAGFGAIGVNNKLDPNLKRPAYNQINVGISQEVFKGVSMSAEWYRTIGKNISYTQNTARAVTGSDFSNNPNYQKFTVFSPLTGDPIPVYDVTAAARLVAATNFTSTIDALTSTYDGFDWGFNARFGGGGRIFGGTTTERTNNNNCAQGIDNPSNILYCDTSNMEFGQSIPWKTQIKASVTYPLPWFGIIANGSLQGLPGYTLARTTYSIAKTTKYTVCPGNSAAAGCVVGAVINPNIVSSSVSVPLNAAGTQLTPRTNQVDFGLSKRLKFGRLRLDPKIDLFNALNSDDYYSVVSTTFAPAAVPAGQPTNVPATPSNAAGTNFTSYHQPARFLQGRIVKIGFNASW
jgi:hypothetical protein